MAELKLTQRVKTQLDELRSLTTTFVLDNLSFNEDEVINLTETNERLIIGRILPQSEIFKEGAFRIEIKLPSVYPLSPPKVRFLTPVYHPNVGLNG